MKVPQTYRVPALAGAGKSTTAAIMDSLGYELVADDMLPISFGQITQLALTRIGQQNLDKSEVLRSKKYRR
jgi:hypothetical protein